MPSLEDVLNFKQEKEQMSDIAMLDKIKQFNTALGGETNRCS